MERVVEKLQLVRPLIPREIDQTVDKTSEMAVSENTESSRHFDLITDRVLHERIRDQNEITRKPTTEGDGNGSGKMSARSEPLLTPNQRAHERALQEEREHAFHRQRLSDHAAGVFGKVRPVRSE